ncbi:MAG: CHAT domain-containing protein, partial [Microcoleaceae cyanobacterium]
LFWHQIPFAALPLAVPTPVNSQPPEKQSSGMIRQAIEIFTRLEKKNTTTNMTGIRPESEIISTQYLGDKFRLRYVPSSQILQYCQQRPQLSQINYGTVEDADGTLRGAVFEGEEIAKLCNIPLNQRLRGKTQATVKNYRDLAKKVQVLHSSHHAQSRLDNPLESILILADGNITLGQIMTPGFRLPDLSDVFLSCCETHLGFAGITDDVLSLSTGFLCAGARSVVSTLWSVDDLATALFSIFYYQYRQEGDNRPEALQKAQIYLRTLKFDKLKTALDEEFTFVSKARLEVRKKWKATDKNSENYQQLDDDLRNFNTIYDAIGNFKTKLPSYGKQEYPFADPFYWAGFICSGLR